MPFANKGHVSQDYIDGAIEITQEQYAEAVAGMCSGLEVTIEGGFKISPPEPEIDLEPEPNPEPTPEELIERFQVAIQNHMDAAARLVGYDDIKTAVTYADEPSVPKFEAEGKALRAWRSLIWAYGYEQIAAVQSGARSLPTPEELIAELPPLVMP
ncbi:hypothetical protein ACF6ZU_00020 [Pseudomonas migulae]|uniref:hypothetical protein n=1 Tax=Pseudomonas migulae TaxID=78543 RepID=UPI003720EE40